MRLEHVAARAGVGKATIYRRWPSKEALAQDLLSHLAAPHIEVADSGNTRDEMLAAVINPMRAVTEFGLRTGHQGAALTDREQPVDR